MQAISSGGIKDLTGGGDPGPHKANFEAKSGSTPASPHGEGCGQERMA